MIVTKVKLVSFTSQQITFVKKPVFFKRFDEKLYLKTTHCSKLSNRRGGGYNYTNFQQANLVKYTCFLKIFLRLGYLKLYKLSVFFLWHSFYSRKKLSADCCDFCPGSIDYYLGSNFSVWVIMASFHRLGTKYWKK